MERRRRKCRPVVCFPRRRCEAIRQLIVRIVIHHCNREIIGIHDAYAAVFKNSVQRLAVLRLIEEEQPRRIVEALQTIPHVGLGRRRPVQVAGHEVRPPIVAHPSRFRRDHAEGIGAIVRKVDEIPVAPGADVVDDVPASVRLRPCEKAHLVVIAAQDIIQPVRVAGAAALVCAHRVKAGLVMLPVHAVFADAHVVVRLREA